MSDRLSIAPQFRNVPMGSAGEYRAAVDLAQDGMMGLGLEESGLVVRWVNRGMMRQSGWSCEELEGGSLGKLLEKEVLEDLERRLHAVETTGRRYHVDVPLRLAGGGSLRCRWLLQAYRDGADGPVRYLVASRPVTVGVPREKDVPAPAGDLARSAREPGVSGGGLEPPEEFARLVAGVAHDFNNVLTVLQTRLTLAMECVDERARHGLLDDAKAGCEAAAALARRLMARSSGCPGDAGEPVHPVKAMEDAIRLVASGPGFFCSLDVCPLPDLVRVDPVSLQQMLGNLLVNAREAMDSRGRIEAEVNRRQLQEGEVADLPAGRYMEWIVRDAGAGISPADLERIFQESFSTKKGGRGIGLASSLRLARAAGGTIVVASEVGLGSEFRLLLPSEIPRPPIQRLVPPPRRLPAGGDEMDGVPVVMVADDNPQVRELLSRQIETLGFTAAAVSSAGEAVEEYARRQARGVPPVAVLMDLEFARGGGGAEAARQILGCDPEARLVACSGQPPDGGAEPAGLFHGWLAKPFGIQELAGALASCRKHEPKRLAMALP